MRLFQSCKYNLKGFNLLSWKCWGKGGVGLPDCCQALPSLSGRSWGCLREAHTITVSHHLWSWSSTGSVYSWYERGKSTFSKSESMNAHLKHLYLFFFFYCSWFWLYQWQKNQSGFLLISLYVEVKKSMQDRTLFQKYLILHSLALTYTLISTL